MSVNTTLAAQPIPTPAGEKPFRTALREISVFADLSEEDFNWLADRMVEARYDAGEILANIGDPADRMTVILEGEMQGVSRNPNEATYIATAGQITGALPFSRLTHFPRTTKAVLPMRIATLSTSHFPEMLQRIPVLGTRLVGIMSDRIRETTRLETQRDKMAALGKLSAGLAHELNNPAAAARRSAANFRDVVRRMHETEARLRRHGLTSQQLDKLGELEKEALNDSCSITALDALTRSDREQVVADWLESHNVDDAWQIAPELVESGGDIACLEELHEAVGPVAFHDALSSLTSTLTLFRLAGEIEEATGRISDLVRAIKEYTFMDRSAEREVDIHDGLETTLKILNHRLRKGIEVIREYDRTMPKVCAHGGELNQVWTNLIDNAIDAMFSVEGERVLRIRTAKQPDHAVVEIFDTGPGIPDSIQNRIFEPFFTTKKMGEGSGMGLDVVYRIIRSHHGEIRVQSKPGRTCFQVRLPFKQPKLN